MPKTNVVLLGLMVIATLSSCASDKVKAENARQKEKEKSGEYVDYYPTGSNIPVRVRKDQLQSTDLQTAENDKALQAAAQKIQPANPNATK